MKGFTFLELLTVIVIFLFVALVVVPILTRPSSRALQTLEHSLDRSRDAASTLQAAVDAFPPYYEGLVAARTLREIAAVRSILMSDVGFVEAILENSIRGRDPYPAAFFAASAVARKLEGEASELPSDTEQVLELPELEKVPTIRSVLISAAQHLAVELEKASDRGVQSEEGLRPVFEITRKIEAEAAALPSAVMRVIEMRVLERMPETRMKVTTSANFLEASLRQVSKNARKVGVGEVRVVMTAAISLAMGIVAALVAPSIARDSRAAWKRLKQLV